MAETLTMPSMDGSMTHSMMGPHSGDPVKQAEHATFTNLLAQITPTHVAVRDGSWFDPNTWERGKVPGTGAKVLIPNGVNVTYDQVSEAYIHTVVIEGGLQFAATRDTKLVVETILNAPEGSLEIGSAAQAIAADQTAQIVFRSDRSIMANQAWDPKQLSKGLVSHGRVNIYGADKADTVALAGDALAGDNVLTLREPPTGWRVGDQIVLGGTSQNRQGSHDDNSFFQDEVLTITAIAGNQVRFINQDITSGDNTVLRFDHRRPDIAERDSLQLYVANTTRNVSFETENGAAVPIQNRAHVMFMHSPDVQVHNAGFYHLGRSDKSQLVDDVGTNVDGSVGYGTNPRGRYALHFHRNGADDLDSTAAVAQGNAVVGSPGWGIVHHDSHANLIDNVVFDVVGAGMAAESGNEIGLWENNTVIKSTRSPETKYGLHHPYRRQLFDFGVDGDAYWVQGAAQVQMRDNKAISTWTGMHLFGESLQGNFFKDVDTIPIQSLPSNLQKLFPADQVAVEVNDIPLQELTGFESYNSIDGMTVWAHMTNPDGKGYFLGGTGPATWGAHEGRSRIDNFKIWGASTGIKVIYSSNVDFENGLIVSRDPQERRGQIGIFQNEPVVHNRYSNIKVEGFSEGIRFDLPKGNISDDRWVATIENSTFANNQFDLGKADDVKEGTTIDLGSYVRLFNNTYADQPDNQAPVARFEHQAIGGLALELNARDSFDPDAVTYKGGDANGIFAFGWDFDNDGVIDQFGSQVEHVFEQGGDQEISLTVWDQHGDTSTLTQSLNVQALPYENPFWNDDFSQPLALLPVSRSHSGAADEGWYTDGRIENGVLMLSKPGQWYAAAGQTIWDNTVRRGVQTLSFNLKNIEGEPQNLDSINEVKVRLWGINGEFRNNPRQADGLTPIGTLPMEKQLLFSQDFGGEGGEFFDWTTFSQNVDLGEGYEYLLFKVVSNRAKNDTDFVALDDVTLTGDGQPVGFGDSVPVVDTAVPEPVIDLGAPEPIDASEPVPVLTREPVARLAFDEGQGNAAADVSAQGLSNGGTLWGQPTWIERGEGYAVALDGGWDAVTLENSQDINLGTHDERTISLWFKPDDLLGTNPRQVLYEEGAHIRGLNIYIDAGRLYMGGWNTPALESGWQGTWLSTEQPLADQWHHVALVLDGTAEVEAGALRAYHNGELVGSGAGSQLWSHWGGIGVGSINGLTRFHDGQTPWWGHGFAGALDDVQIFNDALTGSEVAALAADRG